jgi:RHS repeat-associated protein
LLAAEVDTSAKTLHFFSDHLGTPRLITGNGGVQISRHDYLPFGQEVTGSYQDTERLKFTRHERDESNLDYMHARYYSSGTGRFLSADPYLDIGKALYDPQTWNRFSYVRNNPLNRIDPDGRADIEIKYPPAAASWTQAQRDDWNRKWALEQAAARAGRASVRASPARSSGFRARLEKIVGSLDKSQDADHIQSLVANGLDDAAVNGQAIDRSVNRSAGPLFKNALKGLAEGTPIRNIKFPKLGLGWIVIGLALLSPDPVQAAVNDVTFGGDQMNPASHEDSDQRCEDNPCTTSGPPPAFPDYSNQ